MYTHTHHLVLDSLKFFLVFAEVYAQISSRQSVTMKKYLQKFVIPPKETEIFLNSLPTTHVAINTTVSQNHKFFLCINLLTNLSKKPMSQVTWLFIFLFYYHQFFQNSNFKKWQQEKPHIPFLTNVSSSLLLWLPCEKYIVL